MSDEAAGENARYDVIIVGAGIAGALLAKLLGLKKKRVLILEAGDEIKPNNNQYMKRFYEATSKVPEAPYTPEIFSPQPTDTRNPIAKLTQGQRSDFNLVNPTLINAGRPTVLSISLRAWQEPGKGHWTEKESAKCDPRSEFNYIEQPIEKQPEKKKHLPFASTYERIAGGTARHWMGISLRHLPNDFKMGEVYGTFLDQKGRPRSWPNWPKHCQYEDLRPWYDQAEQEIGVSGDATTQRDFEKTFKFKGAPFDGAPTHGYPMAAIPLSYGDKVLNHWLHEKKVTFPVAMDESRQLKVTPIPAARNSEPFNRRRACAGNASCIPICPIQAKYDPTISLRDALNTGHVSIEYHAVAHNIELKNRGLEPDNEVTGIEFLKYSDDVSNELPRRYTATAKLYVLAANAIETPRLILMSKDMKAIAESRPVGKYLMDHPFYIAAATASEPVYPYRGPLVTGGIEVLRDGDFRHNHASFRVDVSNSGWSLTQNGSIQTIAEDLITGENVSGQNEGTNPRPLAGLDLIKKMSESITKQVSLGFLVEQTPDPENRVTLSNRLDGLGLRRPKIEYNFSDYTKAGLAHAVSLSRKIFRDLHWTAYNDPLDDFKHPPAPDNCSFVIKDIDKQTDITIRYMGAGHIAGTCRMGDDRSDSVVDSNLKSWDLKNMYIAGSSVFCTIGTANPTLTIAALSMRLADHLVTVLDGRDGSASI
jgi:choline dehydrogenase-like flavoprotein